MYGADGKSELNSLYSAHALTIVPDEAGKTSYCGCDITNGLLRILFNKKYLGANTRDCTSEIATVVNTAGKPSNAGGAGATLDFDAK